MRGEPTNGWKMWHGAGRVRGHNSTTNAHYMPVLPTHFETLQLCYPERWNTGEITNSKTLTYNKMKDITNIYFNKHIVTNTRNENKENSQHHPKLFWSYLGAQAADSAHTLHVQLHKFSMGLDKTLCSLEFLCFNARLIRIRR